MRASSSCLTLDLTLTRSTLCTGVKLNAAGTHLLSNGMDNTLRTWDVRAYVSGGRLTGVFEGALVSGRSPCLAISLCP